MKAGLKRVVKTVRGKHGSYRRAYNVKATGSMSAGQALRKHGAVWAASNAATGAAGGAGAMLSHRLFGQRGKIGGHAIVGYGLGSVGLAGALNNNPRLRAVEKDSRRMTAGAHLVMSGVGVVSHVAGAAAGLFGASRVLRPRSINRPQAYDAQRYGTTRFALPHVAQQIESNPRYRKR
jgi:hypothetical protein